ncbi:RnfH family protein [Polaromonas sp.]|jgi:putative ubiquitin-RnfH superfamily antitoxin RatB of RatAB toxin-antitoxin module|uniref:RnfH family protein n=1 Tax=Polaromonas sp. TaxID=1869339 RepID=UPI001D365554|nr:RnfH family protein [Polaromonas sp.]MBT9475996.1 RnfH family protein [Polaromonas sp.]
MAKPEAAKADPVHIVLVYSPAPRQVQEWSLELAEGTSVEQALAASGVFEAFPALLASRLAIGVWGRKSSLAHHLRDNDRVEIYRGLRVDPKVARRERFNRQGVKSAGLFARTRAGAKAGY